MTTLEPARLAVRLSEARQTYDAAWWPRSRSLAHELVELHHEWPTEAGHISRVFVSGPDWDDLPPKVAIPGRRGAVRIGSLPTGTHGQLVLIMLDGQRRSVVVLPPGSTDLAAARLMRAFASPHVPA